MAASPGARRVVGLALIVAAIVATPFALRIGAVDPAATKGPRLAPIDLLERLPFAQVETETRRIDFGSAAGKRHYDEPDPRRHAAASGFLSMFEDDDARRCGVAIGERVEVRFVLFAERPVQVALEATGLPAEEASQTMTVHLNDDAAAIARITLPASPTLATTEFTLPENKLRRGTNRLAFRFAKTVRRTFGDGEPFRYPMAAVFRSLRFKLDDGATAATVAPGDVRVDTFPSADGKRLQRAFVFDEGSRVSVPLRLPAGRPMLRASVFVHPDDRSPQRDVPFRMRIVTADGAKDLIEQCQLDARGTAEMRVPIDIDRDVSLFRDLVVSIQFESTPRPIPQRPLRIVVADPRIEDGVPQPAPEPATAATAALRSACAGKNVVLITLDAAGAEHFTAYGDRTEIAPNVDLLARDGVVFEDTFAPASYTLPSIASLFSGLYPQTHGVVDTSKRLADGATTLASELAKRGYATIGLVTNPNAGAAYGLHQGFQVYDELNRDARLWKEGIAATELAPRLDAYVRAGKVKGPFFLYVHVFQPHAPYRPPEPFLTTTPPPPADGTRARIDAFRLHQDDDWTDADFGRLRDLYRANLRYADSGVRAVLDVLRAADLLDDTLVAVVGDHGEAFGEHGTLEHGDTVFAEEVRVPFILRLPDSVGLKPMRVAGPHSLVDVAPTLLGLVAPTDGASRFDGLDRTPNIAGASGPERPVFQRSLGDRPQLAIRALGHTYIADLRTRAESVFKLKHDPGEDSAMRDADVIREFLRAELDAFLGSRAHVAAPASTADDAVRQASEIGYAGTSPSATSNGPPKSPLARRQLTLPEKP
ncbi:MAG: sulfatase [Planctomycetes bacterium]|nr:sulfatase [Planctomycetota bacterium]